MIQGDEYMRLSEASAALGTSHQWLGKLARAGLVPSATIKAGYVLFARDEFLAWAKEYNQRPKRRRSLTEK